MTLSNSVQKKVKLLPLKIENYIVPRDSAITKTVQCAVHSLFYCFQYSVVPVTYQLCLTENPWPNSNLPNYIIFFDFVQNLLKLGIASENIMLCGSIDLIGMKK